MVLSSPMPTFTPVYLPQFGPNDLNATIAEWSKPPGQQVKQGEVIGCAETTKSVFDLEAPASGIFWPLLAAGSVADTGALIAALGDEHSTQEAAQAWLNEERGAASAAAAGEAPSAIAQAVRSGTLKAELLAQRHQIDLADVPASGERVTEADVQAYLAARAAAGQAAGQAAGRQTGRTGVMATEIHDLVDDRYPAKRVQRLLIIGGGNGAVQIIDALAKGSNQRAVGIVDDNSAIHGKTVAGVPVWGAIDVESASDMAAAGRFDAAVISISTSIPVRTRIFAQWKSRGIVFANVIHPSCVIGINSAWGEGNVLMALCHLGACAALGDNNFLSAYCSIEHHCIVGSHCSFGPAVVTSSRVRIGDGVRFGTGIFIEPGVQIGPHSVVASGLAITQHIPAGSIVKAHIGYSIRPQA